MNSQPYVTAQPKAGPFPETALAPAMTAQRDSSSRSALLQRFEAIRLSEMSRVALLRRTETKFLLSEAQLFRALARLTDHGNKARSPRAATESLITLYLYAVA